MDYQKIITQNRDQILEIAKKYGAFNVRIIGSVARGEAHENSDIDFLVSFKPGRTLLDHAGLIIDLEKLLKIKVDIANDGGLKERYRDEILQNAVEL
ncbi:MAG: nucleotidyltransferase family protein [Anaerolineaceae bacterium]|nr:nucleotidyltransferase family protein [Anaerolineaceae bacterium]